MEYQILQTQADHAAFLTQQIESQQIDTLLLSSFGLWAGINNDGSPSGFSKDNPAAKILDTATAHQIQVQIVVGIPPFSSRSGYKLPPCIYCADAHRRMLQRLFQCRKQWPTVHWFYHPQNHTKLAIGLLQGTPAWAVTGGHNLSDSNLCDLSILLKGPTAAQALLPHFEAIKATSDPDISEIRLAFEEKVRDAQAPPDPKNPQTSEGKAPKEGIFQPAGATPPKDRKIPPVDDVVDLLLALARKQYLPKARFTEVSRSSAWLVNQKTRELKPEGQQAFGHIPAVQAALKDYQAAAEPPSATSSPAAH